MVLVKAIEETSDKGQPRSRLTHISVMCGQDTTCPLPCNVGCGKHKDKTVVPMFDGLCKEMSEMTHKTW